MSKIKKIKIFLASSVSEQDEPELVRDRERIGAFCNQLNAHFVERGLFFHLIDCMEYDRSLRDGGKQAQLDKDIRDSALVFFLFFTKLGQYTRHEFDIALDAYRKNKTPKIITYFRYRNSPDEADGAVKEFKSELDKRYHHYYNVYNNIDALKLGMLMQILMLQLDDGAFLPNVEDGVVRFADISVGQTSNIAMFSNSYLVRLRDDLKNTTQEYLDCHEAYFSLKETGEEDEALYDQYCILASKKAELEAQLKSAEKVILATAEDMYRKTSGEINGEIVTERLARAYHAFEQGKTALARDILNLEEILKDTEHVAEIVDIANERLQAHVNEMLFRIDILKNDVITKESAEEILKIYAIACGFIIKYPLDKFPLYYYACFLCAQKHFKDAIAIAETLRSYNDYAQSVACTQLDVIPLTKEQCATLLNLLGFLYKDNNRYDDAEKAFDEALAICRDFAEHNPNAHNFDVATTLNNLGFLYKDTSRYNDAEKAFNEALVICRGLAQRNPDAHNFDVATTLNNLGFLYKDTNRYDDAERAFNEALAIVRELAKRNSHRYNFDVATTLNNLGFLYKDTNRYHKAEIAFNEAHSICCDLASCNPDAYNFDVATTLNNLGFLYKDTGRYDAAEEAFCKAHSICRGLARRNPDVYNFDVAISLNNLGFLYKDTNRNGDAEKAFNEALAIVRELAKSNPDAYNPYVAMTLYNLGLLYSDTNSSVNAQRVFAEAYEIAKKYPENHVCVPICRKIEADNQD